jgi:hydrogenase/urease accessory protein HupE
LIRSWVIKLEKLSMNFNRLLVSILFLIGNISSFAHEMRPALLQINQVSGTEYELIWKIPRRDNMILSINPVFPDWFRVSQPLPGVEAGDGALFTMHATSEKSIHKMPISINGIANSMVDVIVYVQLLSGEKYSLTIQPSHPTVTIPERDTFGATAWTYGKLGVEHILGGPDHLLFVLALLLIVSGARKIFFTITAFTLAHSLTLSLSALGALSLPGPPVEATIALSIMFLAWELVKLNRGEVVISAQKPWLVSFTFGLLHGLGFAGALKEIGLPQTQVPAALAFFNIGVEVGQLLFIATMLLIGRLLVKKFTTSTLQKIFPAYVIGSVAAFWLVERIIGFWG